MAHFRDSVPSNLSAEKTFEYLAHFSNVGEWDPGVVEAEPLGVGPAQVGSRYRVVTEFASRRNDLVYEIVELDRPRRVRLVAEAPSFTSDDTIEVRQSGGQVRVTYDAGLRMKGLFKLSEPVTRVIFKRVAGRAKDGLEKALAGGRAGQV
ncbi:MAG TPA: SRPBCC family protein [Thermoleophilaceae bacterium]|jgi:Polyketide cyclase / dehydrase and lipid transport|nr:SRPBCC family protein [Thermoleophilaceae bacterium]